MKGWPDYTRVTGLVDNYDEYAQNYPVGIGDGAARLGSIKTYDMRGRVWWMDDFEATVLHWLTTSIGGGGAQGLVSDYVRNGNQALGLTANTGIGRISSAERHWTLPRSMPLGIEFHIAQEANFGDIYAMIHCDDGTDYTYASVRLQEGPPAVLAIMSPTGWIDSGVNVNLSNRLELFHAIKIVFDYSSDEWLRIMYDNQEINMNRIPMFHPGGGVSPQLFIQFGNAGDNINNARCIIDDVILTTMEPE